jgi:hypothetical protein
MDVKIVRVQNVLGVQVGHFDDGEPRIRDVVLAERLGYQRPRKVRDLVERMLREKKLNDVVVCPTAGQTSGGRPGSEYHLTEAQALKVAAKSETETADQILDLLIEVFLRAKAGHAAATPLPTAEQMLAMVRAAVEQALPKFLTPSTGDGVVGRQEGKLLRAALMHVAVIDADGNRRMAVGRRTRLDNELRSQLEFFGSCRSWDNLPSAKLGIVKVLLQNAEKKARDEAIRRNEARQGRLFQ